MRSEINCDNCGDLIGRHYEYPWTSSGQDPPEDIFFHEDDVICGKQGIYCSLACFEESCDTEDL